MIFESKKAWAKVLDAHSEFLLDRIASYLRKTDWPKSPHTINFIRSVVEDLISDSHADILHSIEEYLGIVSTLPDEAENNAFNNDIESLFRYGYLCDNKSWTAFDLCEAFPYKTCPYCNINVLETFRTEDDGTVRPALDHYYPSSRYPHLAISLYNLIPSCTNCNSLLKNDIDFCVVQHLHPLFDNENIIFSYNKYLPEIRSNLSTIREKICPEVMPINPDTKTAESLKTFALQIRYSDYSVRIQAVGCLSTFSNWSPQRFHEIRTRLDPLMDLEPNIQFRPSDYRDIPLGRLKLDLFAQFFAT